MALNVTVEHFERIRSFLDARLDPLFDHATGSEHGFAHDDISRALRALVSQVGVNAAAATLSADYAESDPVMRRYIEQQTDTSWRALSDIARQWKDHPDYLPEFAMQPWDLPSTSKE